MSGPAEKKSTVVTPIPAAALGAEPSPAVKPVQIWAVIGGAILLLVLYRLVARRRTV